MEDTSTSKFFAHICRVIRIIGVGNFWITKDEWPPFYEKLHAIFQIILNISLFGLIILEYGGIFAVSLDEKQKFDNIIFIWAHSIFVTYLVAVRYNEKGIKNLVLKQCLILPSLFVNEDVEISMKKYVKIYTVIFILSVNSTLLFYGIGGINKVSKGEPFLTLITIWPSVEDRSVIADVFRVYYYVLWYFLMMKVLGFYLVVFSQTICLRHQFKHLYCYFMELQAIFEQDLSVTLKEIQFEQKFKFGLKLHAETIWCVRNLQKYLGIAYSGQTALNVCCLVLLMAQALMSERTIVNLLVTFLTVTSVLLTTGTFMWNAGDVTVEAEKLPEAIFFSGWHLCSVGMKTKLCPLAVVALQSAQNPVVITAFNQLPMSYSTYLSIVKSSYSIFTVLY